MGLRKKGRPEGLPLCLGGKKVPLGATLPDIRWAEHKVADWSVARHEQMRHEPEKIAVSTEKIPSQRPK
ncbi:hypothetical protein SRM_00688 [Salinibacter ruber M8]|uniref:Uncharacterized protein n=1 Tax=Salinibacter ruber (strain M8) TaxID=761659 RepID=D5H6F4_SALRM|nr:hypothetical protein SRM_00688 [Salinibacter ruber M8]